MNLQAHVLIVIKLVQKVKKTVMKQKIHVLKIVGIIKKYLLQMVLNNLVKKVLQIHVLIVIKNVQKVKKIVMMLKMNVIRVVIITKMYSMVLNYLEKDQQQNQNKC